MAIQIEDDFISAEDDGDHRDRAVQLARGS